MIVIGIEVWLQEGFCQAWANLSWIDNINSQLCEQNLREVVKVKIKVLIFNYFLLHNSTQ